MLKRWLTNLGAVLALLLVGGLALLVVVVGFNLFYPFVTITLGATRWNITFITQTFYVIMGLLWFGFFLLMEHLLMGEEARAGLLLPRALYAVGAELIVIGLLQVGLQAYAFNGASLAVALVEIVVGGGLVWAARRKPRQTTNPE